jgi:hypothetical protein
MDVWVTGLGGGPLLHYRQYDDSPIEWPKDLYSISKDDFLRSLASRLDSCCSEQGNQRCPVQKECQRLWDIFSERSVIKPLSMNDFRYAYQSFSAIQAKKHLRNPAPQYTLAASFGL